jgi:hypothetical protein
LYKEGKMAIYSAAAAISVGTIANPAFEVKPAASNEPAVMEVGIMDGATTACTYGLGRGGSTATLTSATTVIAEDEGRPAGVTTMSGTFSAAPTVPTTYFRRCYLPATIGAGIIFTFPRGIVLAAGGVGLVTWNIAASTATGTEHAVVDE